MTISPIVVAGLLMENEITRGGGSRTVDRALAVLDLVAAHGKPVRLSDLAQEAGFDISSTSRLLRSLQRSGLIMREPASGRYSLGYKLLHLAFVMQQQSGIRDIAEPVLQDLVNTTNETATVNVLLDHEVVVAARIVCTNQLRIFAPIGTRSPMYCTAAGKAILAFQSEQFINQMMEKPMPRLTPHTIVDSVKMRDELAQIVNRGYAIDVGEREEGLIGIAAPIFDPAGVVFASCGISGSELRITADRLSDIGHFVCSAASVLSQHLGWGEQPAQTTRGWTRAKSP